MKSIIKPCFVIFWLFVYVIRCDCNKFIVYLDLDNLSESDVNFFKEWNVTFKQVLKETSNTIFCPVGYYCPAGTNFPIPCSLGTYCPTDQGLYSDCVKDCPSNFYCPDAKTITACPENTWSPTKSFTKSHCLCNAGYYCTYSKQTQIKLLLNINLQTWLSNSSIQTKLIEAVAAAAGVNTSKVIVAKVVPKVSTGGGNRRLLNELIHVHLEISDIALSRIALRTDGLIHHTIEAVHGIRVDKGKTVKDSFLRLQNKQNSYFKKNINGII